ncbi:MAG: alpha/beta hydrolase [Bacteroidales bacterium]|nr:alpha/beta hydrolase [Bacteroidales bacterium]
MLFHTYGDRTKFSLMLLPGLGVSYEIFLPLIERLQGQFHIAAAEVDGFLLGGHSEYTSVADQAAQAITHVKQHLGGHLDCAYGLSMGGKILSRMLEDGGLDIGHAVLDAAPLLPLPRWLVGPLRYFQCANVWTCYHWTGFWKRAFRSHYFDVLLDECKKVWPYGKSRAVLDGYKDIYTHGLEAIAGRPDIHFWYGTKEAFVAKPQVKHLLKLYPETRVEVFRGMNHGQLLVDKPDEVAERLINLVRKRQALDGSITHG